MKYRILDSPLGKLTISTDGNSLTELHIEGDRYFNAVPDDWIQTDDDPILAQAEQQLDQYFRGERRTFDVSVAASGTPFQRQVWETLKAIPAGSTSSYGDIARTINRPKAVRAVGTAIGRNPVCIIVPCHRVLAGDGSLGGYVAGIERKHQLLQLEKAVG